MKALTSSIHNRILFFMTLAMILPALGLFVVLSTAANTSYDELLKTFIEETALLNERAMQEMVDQTISNQVTLSDRLVDDEWHDIIRQGLTGEASTSELMEVAGFIQTEYSEHPESAYQQGWLVNDAGQAIIYVDMTADSVATPGNMNLSETPTFVKALQLANRGISQGLVVTQGPTSVVFDIVNVLSFGDRRHRAFLFTRIDANQMLADIFEPSRLNGNVPYSYLILPSEAGIVTEQAFVTSRNLTQAGLVTAASMLADGAQYAINSIAEQTSTYTIAPGTDEEREVIGHYSIVDIYGQDFALITEINATQSADIVDIQPFVAAGLIILMSLATLFGVVAFLNRSISQPIKALTERVNDLRGGDYETPIQPSQRTDEVGQLTNTFLQARQTLLANKIDMENRLEGMARDLRIIQEISQVAIKERDVQPLMNQVVDRIVERFDKIYHAQIFIVNAHSEFAVLAASTGEAGKNLLARGHRLKVGSVSVIGQVTDHRQPIVARDTTASDVHRRNEFLPETRAELAIPLQISERIIGALDVQSRYSDSFDESMINALGMLADQLTIAIENARLYTESQRFLSDLETNQQKLIQNRWAEYMLHQRRRQISSASGHNTGYDFSELSQIAQQEGQAVIGAPTDQDTVPFVVPIILREQILGFAEYEVRQSDFHTELVMLAEELVSRLALGIDNARLFNESRQTAERERIVNEISARITGKTEIADILQTAISEVSRVLRTPKVNARLHTEMITTAEDGPDKAGYPEPNDRNTEPN